MALNKAVRAPNEAKDPKRKAGGRSLAERRYGFQAANDVAR